ncbi:bifunctional glutamate N-acetyltransferase/amino-acid acetyltransferase ArgJ [bacterium]|nr:bifunctional glutamate N-acetyltransferase/amino-acid acetyltransferase ArgJ [bacterium]
MIQNGPGNQRTPLPEGFGAYATNSGVRKYRPDLGVIVSDRPAKAVAVYTQNTCQSNHIKYCQKVLPTDGLRVLICNSGQANTATGQQGYQDNLDMITEIARRFDVRPDQVVSASTGIIGVRIQLDKIVSSFGDLLMHKSGHAESFATAIMTTDLVPKTATTLVSLSGGQVRITGVCKGSGMIHPNMATMLGYLFTDADVELNWLADTLRAVTDDSFNMISVDGETSPNDTVFAVANGCSGVKVEKPEDRALFMSSLMSVAKQLAKSIARDGEGATKLLEVSVNGMPDVMLARKVARSIVTSPLVKTAVHGGDPNWGRIYSRIGQEGVPFEIVQNLDLFIGEVAILKAGEPLAMDYYKIRMGLAEDEVKVALDFHSGDKAAVAWGCDLTKKYVDINTEYN